MDGICKLSYLWVLKGENVYFPFQSHSWVMAKISCVCLLVTKTVEQAFNKFRNNSVQKTYILRLYQAKKLYLRIKILESSID